MPDGASIAVWHTSDEGGPAVVFVHGFPENRLCWAPILDILQQQTTFRWVAYDLRGFGQSSKTGPACWQQQVADHLEITRQLGVSRHHMVGHDWGAAIAMHMARFSPESLISACVLNTSFWKIDYLGMWHLWLMNLPLIPGLLFRLMPELFFRKTLLAAFNDPSRLPSQSRTSYLEMYRDPSVTRFWIRLYRNTVRHMARAALPRVLRARIGSSRVELPRPSSSAYQLPIRLIWGVDDTFCPLWVGRAIERRLHDIGTPVHFSEIPDSGHFVTEEQPAAVGELLAAWLTGDFCYQNRAKRP